MTTTLLEEPVVRPSTAPSQRLRTTMAAMRLSFTWFGVRKSLTTEQKAEAAEAFGADGDVLSAGKRLINTRHPKYKAVTLIRNRAVSLWKSVSLPFPEAAIRLVKQDDIDWIDGQMKTFQGELTQAVAELDEHYWELQSAARQRLGRLYPAAISSPTAVCDAPRPNPGDTIYVTQPFQGSQVGRCLCPDLSESGPNAEIADQSVARCRPKTRLDCGDPDMGDCCRLAAAFTPAVPDRTEADPARSRTGTRACAGGLARFNIDPTEPNGFAVETIVFWFQCTA